jgi:hypothetical protein
MPTADGAVSASQYVTNAPSTSQVSPAQVAPQTWANPAPQGFPQAPVPQASAAAPSAGNPWQEAFQALSASLNTPNLSQAPAAYSQQVTPTPQVSTQAAWASQANVAPQTYAHQASTPAYSAQVQAPQQYLQQAMNQQLAASQPVGSDVARDSYLSQISDVSLEVLEHFGAEAPALLNQYACAVEDALIEQVQRGNSLNTMLDAAGEERAAMNLMLTDPDILADYVNDFYGPEGPYPTMTPEEQAAYDQEAARAQFEAEIAAQQQNQVPPNFQRPQMDMPARGAVAQNPAQAFWGDFSQLMDQNPEAAWQYLAQAPQGALQTKMLIQDL